MFYKILIHLSIFAKFYTKYSKMFLGTWGGGQNLERRNVEQSIFQNFKIANINITKYNETYNITKPINITKDELFDSFSIEFTFFIFYKLCEQPKYFVILSNCKILIIQMVK